MRYFSAFLILFILLINSCFSQGHDSLFLASAIEKLENSREYTLTIVDLMPEEKYQFRPTEEEMSFGEQLVHLSYNLGWLSSSYLSNGTNPVSANAIGLQEKDSIKAVVASSYDYAIGVLRNFPAANLGEPVSFFAGSKTKMQIINLLSDHQTHHRGQLIVYLRLCGFTPPKYVGW